MWWVPGPISRTLTQSIPILTPSKELPAAPGPVSAAGEDEEGDAGARGGFTSVRDLPVLIADPMGAVELVPELSVPKAEPAVTSGQPRVELDCQYQLMHAVTRVNKRLVFLLLKACIFIYFRCQSVTI